MRSALTIAIATLLVTSLLPMAIVTAAPMPDTPPVPGEQESMNVVDSQSEQYATQPSDTETTNRLGLDGEVTATYRTPAPDFGTTLAVADDDLRHEQRMHDAEYRWSSLTTAEREETLVELKAALDERVESLETREENAVRAINANEVPADRLLRTKARNDRESAVLNEKYDRLASLANAVPGYSPNVRATRSILTGHAGPVSERLGGTILGTEADFQQTPVLVETSETGAIISGIGDHVYVRDVIRFDNRDPSLPNQLTDRDLVFEQLNQHYPWAHGEGFSGERSINEHYDIQLFSVETLHQQGTLSFHLSGGTSGVFREKQTLTLEALPIESMSSTVSNGLNVSVSRTPHNGPAQLTVRDANSGEPLDANLAIDGSEVAQTGTDGTVWFVPPSTSSELTVQTENASTTIELNS